MARAPVAGRHYPPSTGEFMAWFAADGDCLDYLEWLRWPNGFVCGGLWPCGRLATRRRQVSVHRLRPPDVGDCGHDLRSDPYAADGV
ncbi:MAG: hypothetical protein ACR2HQ_07415, partial [Ilumatobacteraceae bacterium]